MGSAQMKQTSTAAPLSLSAADAATVTSVGDILARLRAVWCDCFGVALGFFEIAVLFSPAPAFGADPGGLDLGLWLGVLRDSDGVSVSAAAEDASPAPLVRDAPKLARRRGGMVREGRGGVGDSWWWWRRRWRVTRDPNDGKNAHVARLAAGAFPIEGVRAAAAAK